MKTAKIKICKKVIIDHSSSFPKAKDILEGCFHEIAYQLRHSAQGFTTWRKIKKHKPDAVALLTKSGFIAVKAYLHNLEWNDFDDFTDHLNINNIPFKEYSLSIEDGDFNDINTFKLAILGFTDELTLIDIVNNKLLLTLGDRTTEISNNERIETFMLELDHNSMIVSYQ
jgi:hypothetical protein